MNAPGAPGIPPKWTSSAKSGIGTAISSASRVWFTTSHGILDELYYPRIDQAVTRDMGFIITDGKEFFSEEKRDTSSEMSVLAEGVPAFKLLNTCKQNRYQVTKEILADPARDVFLQHTIFTPLKGTLRDYYLSILLAPHIGNHGYGNTAWVEDYKGTPMLFAERGGITLALACSQPFVNRSVGFVGVSDAWQDLQANKKMTVFYSKAENGNVAMSAEIDLAACKGEFILGLGFGSSFSEAANHAKSSLQEKFEIPKSIYIREWQDWNKQKKPLSDRNQRAGESMFRTSLTVLKVHEDKHFPGALIAGLSIPWGMNKGDDDLGGYHLVWPRDLVESAGGLLAAGAFEDVERILNYLATTQQADGHWSQNMWLDGTPYWDGIQMDEAAFPILLVDLAVREKAIQCGDFWCMVLKAVTYLVQNGPVTQQDRWEEDSGYSPFTLAVEISALLAAAEIADLNKEKKIAAYLRETADVWNACIEPWIYVTDTELAKKVGVEGYYVRIAPPEEADAASPKDGFVPIKNRPPEQSRAHACEIISPDALALVRFGLRSAKDPRILNTVKVIDFLLKQETPVGPGWHRYNGDGYGEHEDGSPFDGTGIGRLWPLLTGERGHYELAAGNKTGAQKLLKAMVDFSSDGGMIPEQCWDSKDIPEKELFLAKPSGSAMPLVWAHSEYIKLLRSIEDGKIFDMPRAAYERYVANKNKSPYGIWRFNHKLRTLPVGKILRIETLSPATIHWSVDGWKTTQDTPAQDTGLGVYVVDLNTKDLPAEAAVVFTFYWTSEKRWEGSDFNVGFIPAAEKKSKKLSPNRELLHTKG